MPAPSLTQHFGVPIDELSPLFYACLGAAIWLVYLFCRKQFAERIVTGDNDYIYQLLPRQLATHEEYSKGFMIYFVSIATVVVLLALLGPENMKSLGITLPTGLTYVTLPPAIALILMGALPTVPGLTLIETRLREYAHERAYIPASAHATAQRLAAADFDFDSYQAELLSPELRGVDASDFTRPRNSLEHAWARLCCLVFVQKSYRMSGLTDLLDGGLLQFYEKDLELIESRKITMEAEIAAYRHAKESDPFYTNDALRRAVRDNLYKLYILLGCAVRLKKQPHDEIDWALGRFGFKLNQTARAQDMGDVKLVGLAVVALSITLVGLAATVLGHFGLWRMSPVFPQTMFQPLVDAVSTLVPHATALMVADLVRRRAINKGSWYRMSGSRRRANSANYVRVALVSGIAGYVALILWGLTQQVPTLDGFKIDAPNALLGMVTGGFYVYHLDNTEIGRRPSRAWELGAQSVATGFCGLIAACATWQIIFGAASEAIDRIVLTTAINATVGFAFGWYIPQAAAAQYDPRAEASEERVRTLQMTARARLGDTVATAWIDKPHPSLANKTPRAAVAADVDGLERAISLLQGPQALVA